MIGWLVMSRPICFMSTEKVRFWGILISFRYIYSIFKIFFIIFAPKFN